MALTSRSASFSASSTASNGDVTVQQTQAATVVVESPDETCRDQAAVSVMGDAIGVGDDTLAYTTGFSVVDGGSFYGTVDLLAVAASDDPAAYASTGALIRYSGSADAVFSIQTSSTYSVSTPESSFSASATSGTLIGVTWTGDIPTLSSGYDTPDISSLIDDQGAYSIDANVAFAIGDASAFGDFTITDLSLSVFTMEDMLSSASIEIMIIG